MITIKRYNQVLLSILGTVVLIFALLGGTMVLITLYQELRWEESVEEVGMISNERVEEMAQDSIRKQLITFNRIILVDTLNEKYVLPVSQANLIEDEYFDDSDPFGLTNIYTGGKTTYYSKSNAYCNLMIYDKKANTSKSLFQKRVSINEFYSIEVGKVIYLVMSTTNKDTNKDGYLNSQDLQELVLYNMVNGQLLEVPTKEKDFLNLEHLYPSNDFIILYGIDRNKDGIYNSKREPKFFYKLNFNNGSIDLLIDEMQLIELQNRLEGTIQ
ncbi:MAG: hypothetical protein AAFO07_31120 [Bacteroidota bacterium]